MAVCSVLIVDDEYYAREGIREMISSLGGYRIVGNLDNSPEALAFIAKYRPDIVLTDINMPEMDGIELIWQASQVSPNTKYLIITGHDKFEYAKRAIKLDIVDFILKPIDEVELAASMQRAADMLRRDSVAMRREVLDYLRKESNAKNAEHHIPWTKVQLLLLQFDNLKRVQGSEAFIKAETILRCACSEYNGGVDLLVNVYINRMVCLMDGQASDSQLIPSLIQRIGWECGINLTVVEMSSCLPGELPEVYLLARKLINERFYQGLGITITESLKPSIKAEWTDFGKKLEAVEIAVAAGDESELKKRLFDLYEMYRKAKLSKNQVYEQAMKLYLFALQCVRQEGISVKPLESYSPILHSTTLMQMYQAASALLAQTIRLIRDERSGSEESAVKQAIAIIGDRFCGDLTLEQLAGEVYLNQSYLSRKLKEVLGESFIKYMTRLRMERAVKLLQEGGSVEQVARTVGYGNYRHFSDLFKQHTGYTPSRFIRFRSL